MKYSEPLPMSNGKWVYATTSVDGGSVPIGHCAEDCLGHETPEAAREHYRDYVIAKARFGVEMRTTLKCRVCDVITFLAVVTLPQNLIPLCTDHHDEYHLRFYVGHDHAEI